MVPSKYQMLVTTAVVFSELLLSPTVKAANIKFKQTFAFGNSRIDTGNFSSLTNDSFPPRSLYTQGRFTNEFIWIDRVNQDYLGLNPSIFYSGDLTNSDDGITFATGAATTGTTSLAGSGFPGVTTQVADFISFLDGTKIDEEALVVLWAGENDYVENIINQGTILNPEISVGRISDALKRLVLEGGAKNILVSNLFNFGDIPLGRTLGNPEDLNQLSTLHNNLLALEIESLSAFFPDTNFVLFDVDSVLENIFNNPIEFGINSNPITSCLSPNNFPEIDPNVVLCDNPDQFFYFDNQHFTSKIHSLIGDAAIETIETEFRKPIPEPKTIFSLVTLGIGLLFKLSKKQR